jgi:sugar fermentation stimulation protein A
MKIEIHKAKVIYRPSKKIKSPYMADIEIDNIIELAHSPSLGLCGLIKENSNIFVSQCKNECRKSKYTIELVESNKVLIGANPLFANKIFSNFYSKFNEFKNYEIEKKEVKIHNSRLDFLLVKNDKKCYVEIKNVPLVEITNNTVVATFPDGYKNTKNICISDRAYKHIEDLIKLKDKGFRVSLVFIVQRSDAEIFSPNYSKDKIYSEKLKEAFDKGVEIYAYKFSWRIKNNIATCKFMQKIDVQFLHY